MASNSQLFSNKKFLFFSLFFCSLFLFSFSASAHQPQLVPAGQTEVKVEKPEISQAFYGSLRAQPVNFTIESDKDFTLYVNLLLPKLPDANKRTFVAIYLKDDKGIHEIAYLNGEQSEWKEMYEPFGGDWYWQSEPAFKKEVKAGTYLVQVVNICPALSSGTPGNQCVTDNAYKFVLAIGEKESWTPLSTYKTLKALPHLKKDFFEESPWTAYNNYVGLIALGFIALIIVLVILIIWLFKKRNKSQTL